MGLNLEDVTYTNYTNRKITFGDIITDKSNADLHFIKYGAFAQVSKTYLVDRLVTLGIRTDGNHSLKIQQPQTYHLAYHGYNLNGKSTLTLI